MKGCFWRSQGEGYYITSCGGNFHFENGGTPADNLFNVCPYCGDVITTRSLDLLFGRPESMAKGTTLAIKEQS